MEHVVVRVGDNLIESAITRRSRRTETQKGRHGRRRGETDRGDDPEGLTRALLYPPFP